MLTEPDSASTDSPMGLAGFSVQASYRALAGPPAVHCGTSDRTVNTCVCCRQYAMHHDLPRCIGVQFPGLFESTVALSAGLDNVRTRTTQYPSLPTSPHVQWYPSDRMMQIIIHQFPVAILV